MTPENRQKIMAIMAKQLCADVATLDDDKAIEDFDGDSLDMCETVIMIEDDCNVEIIDFDMDPAITIAQFLALIEKNAVGGPL